MDGIRFEIRVNGEKHCTAGMKGQGVLSAIVNYVRRQGDKESEGQPPLELVVSGLKIGADDSESGAHVGWGRRDLSIGDEISIRLLSDGEHDPPASTTPYDMRQAREAKEGE